MNRPPPKPPLLARLLLPPPPTSGFRRRRLARRVLVLVVRVQGWPGRRKRPRSSRSSKRWTRRLVSTAYPVPFWVHQVQPFRQSSLTDRFAQALQNRRSRKSNRPLKTAAAACHLSPSAMTSRCDDEEWQRPRRHRPSCPRRGREPVPRPWRTATRNLLSRRRAESTTATARVL